ncbi:MAG: GTP-binding protein [Tissierellia bacterium]|nr:GTP-binding protein [Tissierellia bacterium]
MSKRTKLYLLTGFLGAGKTTFLSKVLQDLEGSKVAVIMNEFGKVGIDGSLIKKEGMELLELNSGSIFCSCLQLSFVSALVEIADREMDYLFVESSGLADPSNIGDFLDAVMVVKGDIYDYSGTLCIVDGVNFLDQVKDIETVQRQLKFAHLVIVAKADLIEASELADVKAKIREINGDVPIVESINGTMNYNFLEQNLMHRDWMGEETTNTTENRPKTLTLTFKGPTTKVKLGSFLDLIKKDSYRIKGFFELEDGWNQIDVVGKKIDYKKTKLSRPNSEIVIISRIGNQIIRPIFSAWQETVGEEMKLK